MATSQNNRFAQKTIISDRVITYLIGLAASVIVGLFSFIDLQSSGFDAFKFSIFFFIVFCVMFELRG